MRVKKQGVSHLSGIFSFSIRREELRGDFINRGFVVTVRGRRRGSGRGGRLGRVASGQLGRGHVLIEVCVLIVRLLFSLAPPCAGSGVLCLWVLRGKIGHACRQAERGEERWIEGGKREVGDSSAELVKSEITIKRLRGAACFIFIY